MEPKIIERDGFVAAGLTTLAGIKFNPIAKLWDRLMKMDIVWQEKS